MNIPLVESLDLQLAGRFEDYDDIGTVTKPRIALGWYLIEGLQIRGSYSEGFKAPNLAATSEPDISRTVGNQNDWIFCEAQVRLGTAATYGACIDDVSIGNEFAASIQRITSGSKALKPEESESLSFGIVFQPSFIQGLTLTVDYWDIDQTGIIGIFGTPNHLALDWALRVNGLPPNPDVFRAPPTQDNIDFFTSAGMTPVGTANRTLVPYFNLDNRDSAGVDYSILYDMETTSMGAFRFGLNVAQLTESLQTGGAEAEFINAQNNPAIKVTAGGDLIEQDQRPEWKGSGYVRWNSEKFGAGLFVNYIGEFNDTSAIGLDNRPWRVQSMTTINLNGEYRFSMAGFSDATFKVGINNVADEDPPLADENLNCLASMHNPMGRYAYVNLVLGLGGN